MDSALVSGKDSPTKVYAALALLFDCSPTPAACIDAEGRIRYANPALNQAWTGSSLGTFVGDFLVSHLPNHAATQAVLDARRSGNPWTGTVWGVLPGHASTTLSITPVSQPDTQSWLLVQFLSPAAESAEPAPALEASTAAQYVVAFAESSEAMILINSTGEIEELNRSACELLGQRREALIGTRMTDHLLTCDNAYAGSAGAPQAGQVALTTRSLMRGTGTIIPVTIRGRCLSDGRVLGFLRNMEGPPCAPDRSEEAESRRRATFDACFQFMGLLDPRGTLLDANRTALEFAGVTLADVVGQPFWETPWWRDDPGAIQRLREAIAEAAAGHFVRFETIHANAQGARIHVDFSLKPLMDDAGAVVYLVPEGRDITKRRAMEEALQRSEARFRLYFELNLIGMAMTSPVKGWLQVNDRLCEILGYTREELTDLTWSVLTYPADLAADEALFEQVLAGDIDGYDLEKRFIRKDGQIIYAAISVKCLRDASGSVEYFVSLLQDISDRKRAEEKRMRMERKLLHTQKLESLGVMAGGIAHDFNNLLTAISGNLELVRMNQGPSSVCVPWIDRAEEAARRAADLTRQMLAYAGRGRFLVCHLDLNKLVEGNAALLLASLPRSVDVALDLTPALPLILADPGQMQQVLMNLITNAAEAIGDGEGQLRIATGVITCDAAFLEQSRVDHKPAPGTFIYLDVTDTGCGMDQITRDRLFDPFFTTKFTGRGLGMSAVLGILRSHDGALFLQSAPGAGTSIRVLFPRVENVPVPVSAPLAAPSNPAVNWQRDNRQRTVMLVDDEAIVRELGKSMLEHLGLHVLTAANGEEAVRLFQVHGKRVDALLMDVSMPHINGQAATEAILQMDPTARIILASGHPEESVLGQSASAGPALFLQKPYTLEGVRERLGEVFATEGPTS